MRTRKVVVLPYDVAWQSAFKKIKGEIEEAIGDLIIGIEHVGSTSAEGMSAKPCIDIDVINEDYSAFAAVVDSLKAIGYIHEGDLGIKDREAFKYSGKEHLQMHQEYFFRKKRSCSRSLKHLGTASRLLFFSYSEDNLCI